MKHIIDVSKWQGTIDWETVKGNVDGVILRVGRGTVLDDMFLYNAKKCTELDIPFGVYLYSVATTIAGAEAEAEFVLSYVKDYAEAYPIYFDTEETGTGQTAAMCAKVFCDKLESAGYFAGIYASQWWWNTYLTSLGNRYSKWVARWGDSKPNVDDAVLWQYTSNGNVDGITGRVDCSYLLDDSLPNTIVGKGFNNNVPVSVPSSSLTGVVTGNTVYIRGGAGTSYSILCIARKGETYEVLGSEMNGTTKWWHVAVGNISGYISGVYFKVEE